MFVPSPVFSIRSDVDSKQVSLSRIRSDIILIILQVNMDADASSEQAWIKYFKASFQGAALPHYVCSSSLVQFDLIDDRSNLKWQVCLFISVSVFAYRSGGVCFRIMVVSLHKNPKQPVKEVVQTVTNPVSPHASLWRALLWCTTSSIHIPPESLFTPTLH